MAQIHKLEKLGVTIYPATTTDAVVSPQYKISVTDVFTNLNNKVSNTLLIAGTIPNFDTVNKTFDIGTDTHIISEGNYYDIKNLISDNSYRNINYCAEGQISSLQKLLYNTETKKIYFTNCINKSSIHDILIGCIVRNFSTGEIKYIAINCEYTINSLSKDYDLKNRVSVVESSVASIDERVSSVEERVYYTSVDTLYKDAWVRYSDGFISESSGGAKLYILKKEDVNTATKIKAFVTTQARTFAAIAFYNGEPDVSTYMKKYSVEGKNDSLGTYYEADLPAEDWFCALILDMSQLGNKRSILLDEPPTSISKELVNDLIESNSKIIEENVNNLYGSFLNVTSSLPYYHHLNQEKPKNVIPAQSLFDIHYAKSLGFKMIEVNVHKCSDGVYVCKHGINGALGAGVKSKDGQDYSNTKFSDVTSTWLRENITYDVYLEKYNGHIPTLDEFCRECKKLSMVLKISSNDIGVLNIARKYLPDDMLWTLFNERNGYRGTIEYVYYKDNETVDNAMINCRKIGAPLNLVIASGTFPNYTDEELTELVEKSHANGFTVSMVYPTTNNALRALNFGIDAICATNTNANLLSIGNAKNISNLDNSDLIISPGSQYNSDSDTISLVDSGTIDVNTDRRITYKQYGMCSVRIRYKGILTIVIGHDSVYETLQDYENDGSFEVAFCNILQPLDDIESFDKWITIKSKGETEIYKLDISCSYL